MHSLQVLLVRVLRWLLQLMTMLPLVHGLEAAVRKFPKLEISFLLIRGKLIYTALASAPGNSLVYVEIGMGSANNATPIDNAGIGLDFIGLQQRIETGVNAWGLVGYDNSGFLDNPESPEMNFGPTTITYYLEIKRLSSTSMSIGLYTTADFDVLVMPIETKVINNTITGLQYLRVGNATSASGTDGNQVQGTIEDLQIWDGVTAADQSCAFAIDDDLATSWKSTSEVNPNIYVDMTSATTTSNLALYPNAGTTVSEIKIQSSTDAIAWTDKRTITWSNLTEGAWNYIRFNLVSARYWRIYGNSGGAAIMQIDEIKVLDAVSDNDVRNLHGHIPISSTDTSLNNAGV